MIGKIQTVLWVQGKSVEEENIMSCNGVRIGKSDECYYSYYSELIKKDSFRKLKQIKGRIVLYKEKKNRHMRYIIHGHYAEMDVVGRSIGFMASVWTDDVNLAIEALIKESELYGYSLTDGDIQFLKNTREPRGCRNKVASVVCVVVIVIIISVLWI